MFILVLKLDLPNFSYKLPKVAIICNIIIWTFNEYQLLLYLQDSRFSGCSFTRDSRGKQFPVFDQYFVF